MVVFGLEVELAPSSLPDERVILDGLVASLVVALQVEQMRIAVDIGRPSYQDFGFVSRRPSRVS